ncbi:hypothetical protein IG631_17359 [Alternaria alternata]|nr:hypothetical protein IG631_17359 [Alternaria alternata]
MAVRDLQWWLLGQRYRHPPLYCCSYTRCSTRCCYHAIERETRLTLHHHAWRLPPRLQAGMPTRPAAMPGAAVNGPL